MKLENVAIANALQFEAAWATPALSRFNYDAMLILTSLNCRIIAFLLLIQQYYTPWYWPLTLNICSISSVTWWNSVPNLNAIEQSAAELLRFQCLTLWPWTCFKCCARLCGNFHKVWPSTTYPCLNYNVFNAGTLCQAVALTFDLLSLKVCGTSNVMWSKSVRNLNEIEQSPVELLIILQISNFCTRYVTLRSRPLTSWHWTFTALRMSCV